MVKIRLIEDEFLIDEHYIIEKEQEDEEKLMQVIEFAKAADKKKYIEDIFMEGDRA